MLLSIHIDLLFTMKVIKNLKIYYFFLCKLKAIIKEISFELDGTN